MESSKASDRRVIHMQAASAVVFSAVLLTTGTYLWPISIPSLPTVTDRLVFTLQWQMFSFLTLLAGVMVVGNTRFNSIAIDPLSGKGEHLLLLHNRYVQNTLEQLVLNIPAQLILSTYLNEQQMRVIPLLVILFVIGRIAFRTGYGIHYTYRAFGFSMTVMPTLFTYAASCYLFFFNK